MQFSVQAVKEGVFCLNVYNKCTGSQCLMLFPFGIIKGRYLHIWFVIHFLHLISEIPLSLTCSCIEAAVFGELM